MPVCVLCARAPPPGVCAPRCQRVLHCMGQVQAISGSLTPRRCNLGGDDPESARFSTKDCGGLCGCWCWGRNEGGPAHSAFVCAPRPPDAHFFVFRRALRGQLHKSTCTHTRPLCCMPLDFFRSMWKARVPFPLLRLSPSLSLSTCACISVSITRAVSSVWMTGLRWPLIRKPNAGATSCEIQCKLYYSPDNNRAPASSYEDDEETTASTLSLGM